MSDGSGVSEVPIPSDEEPRVAAWGSGDVGFSVVSMSECHADGRDAEYLDWHLNDHLPEQHRLAGLRLGQRWVSTPACRAARLVSDPPFDAVDHLVQYLFAEPAEERLDPFFQLGATLRRAGRMPIALPRVQVGGWNLATTLASSRALVGAAVLPWRPSTGAYVLIDSCDDAVRDDPLDLEALVAVEGVAGAWRWLGSPPRHDRLEPTAGLTLTIAYLDADPVEVATALRPVVEDRSTTAGVRLAAPFAAVDPQAFAARLP